VLADGMFPRPWILNNFDVVDRIYSAKDRDQWRTLVNSVMSLLGFIKEPTFFTFAIVSFPEALY
jgi:hypothetical protein